MNARAAAEARVVRAKLALANAAWHASEVQQRFGILTPEYATARAVHASALSEYRQACMALNDLDAGVPAEARISDAGR